MPSTKVAAAKLCVWYAPLPEERNPNESASRAFADRIIAQSNSTAKWTCDVVIKILDLEIIKTAMTTIMTQAATDEQTPTLHFFVVSCDADGSVHKAVRKISRELSKKGTEISATETHQYYAVVLLGHARCENSAQQMKDTIFTAGRKFDKVLDGSFGARLRDRVEVQAELEGPDESFDPWVKAALDQLMAQTL
jgi:hypothetical protein